MCEDAMVKIKKRNRKSYSPEELTESKLRSILLNEKIDAEYKDIRKRHKDPNGNCRQKEEKEQRYVDACGPHRSAFDKRPISIIANEEVEDWWRFAPQAIKYRATLNESVEAWQFLLWGYMLFWVSLAVAFIYRIESVT